MRVDIGSRLIDILDRVRQAAVRANRDPDQIRVLAATKTRTGDEIKAAIESGIDLIGENRVQEAMAKFTDLPPVRRHFIGHLQTNKVKHAVRLFDCIESVDRRKLAQTINNQAGKIGKRMPVLIEVNLAGEATKSGVSPEEAIPFAKEIAAFKHLHVQGLMAMPPYAEDPETVRPYFKLMATLYNELSKLKAVKATLLSMGTSHDFEVAIAEGATLVRLGTVLFGPRS